MLFNSGLTVLLARPDRTRYFLCLEATAAQAASWQMKLTMIPKHPATPIQNSESSHAWYRRRSPFNLSSIKQSDIYNSNASTRTSRFKDLYRAIYSQNAMMLSLAMRIKGKPSRWNSMPGTAPESTKRWSMD
jgi:hypothetical protein